ncbi:translation initiation factor IF-2-like [Gopherus flavomarginatus]|uniref:translation initiation factor IF-2-like n=1 Tax=Gopherus flavomarginatus TaxID=286002 RepID=UPI0021CC1560|nr:translation initiation factor IF-2-like [Gopherus flavomarginatus]
MNKPAALSLLSVSPARAGSLWAQSVAPTVWVSGLSWSVGGHKALHPRLPAIHQDSQPASNAEGLFRCQEHSPRQVLQVQTTGFPPIRSILGSQGHHSPIGGVRASSGLPSIPQPLLKNPLSPPSFSSPSLCSASLGRGVTWPLSPSWVLTLPAQVPSLQPVSHPPMQTVLPGQHLPPPVFTAHIKNGPSSLCGSMAVRPEEGRGLWEMGCAGNLTPPWDHWPQLEPCQCFSVSGSLCPWHHVSHPHSPWVSAWPRVPVPWKRGEASLGDPPLAQQVQSGWRPGPPGGGSEQICSGSRMPRPGAGGSPSPTLPGAIVTQPFELQRIQQFLAFAQGTGLGQAAARPSPGSSPHDASPGQTPGLAAQGPDPLPPATGGAGHGAAGAPPQGPCGAESQLLAAGRPAGVRLRPAVLLVHQGTSGLAPHPIVCCAAVCLSSRPSYPSAGLDPLAALSGRLTPCCCVAWNGRSSHQRDPLGRPEPVGVGISALQP